MPEIQVRNTYYQLGKIYVYKLKVSEAVECLTLASSITHYLHPNNLLYLSKCDALITEVHLKAYSQRNPSALDHA
jgi:hypothetical protein